MAQDAVKYKAIVIGGSAGSLDAIIKIVEMLPTDAGVVYMIVVHRKNDADSILADLLASKTIMKVKEVEDKDAIVPNCIYVAPADYHLLLEDEKTFALDSSEKIYFCRPSIDITFESVAAVFGESCIGVLLSGANADGAEGLAKIKEAGGYTIVQEPSSAAVSYMPQQALKIMQPDAIKDVTELPNFIRNLIVAK